MHHAVNAYALSTLLYGAQYACAIPAEHATCLVKWSAAVVDAGLGPDDDMRRPPGIPTSCMAAHPRQGGFGLLPLREHMFSRWACEAAQLLVGGDATPWLAIGRALQAHLLRPLGGDGVWSLALCGHAQLFDSHSAVLPLPHPLRALAVGLRALPPLQYVGDEDSLPVGSWCWHAPLWSNPFLVRPQTWLWFGSQRSVLVGFWLVWSVWLRQVCSICRCSGLSAKLCVCLHSYTRAHRQVAGWSVCATPGISA